MSIKTMAQSKPARRKPAIPAPAPRAAAAPAERPPMTYGSWMELGLAARQMMAAAGREGVVAPKARHR